MSDTLAISEIGPEASKASPGRSSHATLTQSALLWDSLSYFGSKIVPGFMGLISVPVFIRLIGLNQYGRFAVVVPFLMAVAGASSGWLAQGVLRFHPSVTDSRGMQAAFDRAVAACSTASAIVTALLLATVLAGLHYSTLTSLCSLVYCLSLLVYTVVLSRFQARLRPGSVLRREAMRSICGFVFPVIMIAITGRKQFELILLGQAVAYTFAFLPGSRRSKATEEASSLAFEHVPVNSSTAAVVRQLWRFGWAVGLWLLLSQLLPMIDRWTIQRFAGFTSAGVYSSLYEISVRSFSFLVFPLAQAAHPRIMRSWNEGEFAASYRIIRYSIVAQLIIFAVVMGGVFVLAPRIIRLVLGFNDPVAARMLPVLVVGGFLWQLALLLHKPLEISQRTSVMLAAIAIVVVLNTIACFLFIPRYGYEAAGYVMVSSAAAYIALILCMTRFRAFRAYSPLAENC
jgi:O-antigen/teichoic acid export membrane protein